MTAFDLQRLLATETDRVEWMRSPRNTDEVLRAVCALANDLGATDEPGYLLVGVDPHTGSAVEMPFDEDSMQQDLVNRIESTRLVPTPSYDIQVARLDGGPILVVTVHPFPVPPVVTVNGIAWVRAERPRSRHGNPTWSA